MESYTQSAFTPLLNKHTIKLGPMIITTGNAVHFFTIYLN